MTSLQSRLLVSAVGVPIILLLILWAPLWALAAALMALAGIAAWELMNCVGAGGLRFLRNISICGAVLSVAASYRPDPCYFLALAVMVLLIFGCAVVKGGEVKFTHIAAALMAVFVIPYAFSAFLRLDAAGFHRGFLLLPLVFSFGSDTCAYFAGNALGKHKLAPHVSPHKTVEGAVGGLIGDALCGVVFALVMNTWFDHAISYVGIALLGIGCSVVAQLGDLSFSLIKREFGVKDYGTIFLAHGGVLDRFDSVIFVAPTLALLVELLFV